MMTKPSPRKNTRDAKQNQNSGLSGHVVRSVPTRTSIWNGSGMAFLSPDVMVEHHGFIVKLTTQKIGQMIPTCWIGFFCYRTRV
jgi:hypothetical protein